MPDERNWEAELQIAIQRVLRLILWHGYSRALGRDWEGEYVPGCVLRDVSISRGDEILAVVKIAEDGVYVIQLPIADLGRGFLFQRYPLIENDAEPIITFVPEPEH